MGFDLRPYTRDDPADGQIIQSPGSPSGVYNCTLACLRDTAWDYGYGHPSDLNGMRNLIMAEFGRMGLSWSASIRVAQQMFPGLASIMSIQYPGDIVAALQGAGAQGYMVHGGFWCSSDAQVPPAGPVTYSHALRLRWGDGGGEGWQNPEPWPDVYLNHGQLVSLYDGGGILVFTKSVLPAFQTFSGSGG